MATISELLQKIRTAVYGKDVRSAIADSIQKCYDDATSGAITIPDGSITAEKLADGAVTSDKIAAKSITNGKIADDGAIIKVLYNGAVVQDIQNRPNFADISTVVKDSISDDNSLDNNYPVNGFAVKNYLRSNQSASMSTPAYGNSRLTINGVTVRVPVLDESGVSGGVIYPSRLPLATTETAGAMSSDDKQKLDAIDLDDLENLSDISIELASTDYGYIAYLTLNGETYRIPYMSPNGKLNAKNIPTAQAVNSEYTNPVASSAVYDYVNGSANGDPGVRKLVLNLNGVQYELPMILANGKVSSSYVYTENEVTSSGTAPVNGKAVYDYIDGLDIGAPTDAQVDSAVSDWMEDNIGYYVTHGIDSDSTAGYIELHTNPDDPETDTVLYAPLLETTSSVIASKYLPSATSDAKGAVTFQVNGDAPGGWLKINNSYAPLISVINGEPTTIRNKFLPSATSVDKGAVIVDDELDDESTNPVQNAVIASEFDDLRSQIEQSGGLTEEIKSALLQIASKVAYSDADGETYYQDLYDAFYPPIPATAISLNISTLSFSSIGETQQLIATLTPSDTTDSITWESSDTSVATVSGVGLVTAVNNGSATITVTAGNVSATCSVLIEGAHLPVWSLSSSNITMSGTTISYTDGKLTMGSQNAQAVFKNLPSDMGDKTIEIEFGTCTKSGSGNKRMLIFNSGTDGIIYKGTGSVWSAYFGSAWVTPIVNITDANAISNGTLKVYISSDKKQIKAYINDTKFIDTTLASAVSTVFRIGAGSNAYYTCEITGINIYEGEV